MCVVVRSSREYVLLGVTPHCGKQETVVHHDDRASSWTACVALEITHNKFVEVTREII